MVIERFEALIQQHVILAAFLTMLVGGGGNSSGQTVAELVKRLGMGEIQVRQLPHVLLRELFVGFCLAIALGIATFPRVRLLSNKASNMDALVRSWTIKCKRVLRLPMLLGYGLVHVLSGLPVMSSQHNG